jgi:prophage DNA circulation protein
MTWRTEYQPGSFRGVPFRTEGHERSGGRRVATFEFPGRDQPLVEDLGRRARVYSVDCHVIGADYRARRDALLDALEAAGPGLLVHPWHGQMMVVVQDFSQSEDQAGGIATFRITFGEAGQPVAAPAAVPAGLATAIEADAQHGLAPALFAQRFAISGAADFVEQASARLLTGMVEVTQIAAGLQGGAGPALRAFEAGLRFLPGNLSALLRAPVNLAHATIGMISALALLGPAPRTRIAALTRLTDWQPSDPVFPERTPSRVQEADNRRALLWLFRSAAAAELARVAAVAPFSSYDEALAARDAVTARLDALALEAADRGEDAQADGYDRLRHALVRDVAARGSSLARLHALTLDAPLPALVIANRLYGRADVEARAADVAARNRIVHPGFMPAAVPLQLLTQELAA